MQSPAQPLLAWTDQVLDPLRQVTDPLADAVVADVFQHGQAEAVNTLLRTLIANDDLPSDHLPPGMREYLATSAQLPAWVDPARLQAGERVFWRYGPEIILNLFCYGLPSCYAAAKGVQVLAGRVPAACGSFSLDPHAARTRTDESSTTEAGL
jgi:hypothetical protein